MTILKELATRSLYEYFKQAWPVLEPETPFVDNWHIGAICEYLEAFYSGQILRLLINMPPRYLKSSIVTVAGPTWVWGPQGRPSTRWLFSSYSASLSTKHSIDRRTIMQDNWYRQNWGDSFKFSTDQNVKTEYTNDKRGHMISTSTGGSATGKGGDFVIVDDPVNPKDAFSDTLRKEANTFFDQTLSTRLDNKKKGGICIVMQRLHEKDLSGYVLDKAKELGPDHKFQWTHLCLPAEAPRRIVVDLPISKKRIIREQGDILCEEREGPEELEAQKRNLGSYGYAGQYQQDPSPEEGGILKRAWWRFYRTAPDLNMFNTGCIAMDASFKNKVENDWVVIQAWGKTGRKKYLLDQIRRKMNFPQTMKAFKEFCVKYPMLWAKVIEDKANGPAIIAQLKDIDGMSGIIAADPMGGKIPRAHAITPTLEAGDVYIPDPELHTWSGDYIEETAKFPNAEFDDQVDCTTHALIYLTTGEIDMTPEVAFLPWL